SAEATSAVGSPAASLTHPAGRGSHLAQPRGDRLRVPRGSVDAPARGRSHPARVWGAIPSRPHQPAARPLGLEPPEAATPRPPARRGGDKGVAGEAISRVGKKG